MKPFTQLFSRIAIAPFLILIGAINLFAQQTVLHQNSNEIREIPMQYLSTAEGLSQGLINDMVIDQLGYLYVATKEGLNRFDGISFKVYRHSPKDPKSIADNYVTALFVDDNNRIWAGTYNNGLDYFDPSTETFTHISLDELNEKSSGLHNIVSIHSVGNRRLIVRIGNDLKVIEQNSTKKGFLIREIEGLYPGLNGAFQNNFHNKSLICQTNGTIWIKNGGNIFRYSTKGLEPISIDIPLQNDYLSIERLWENPFTKQICLILEKSILQYDATTNRFLPWLTLPASYSFSKLVFADHEGNIWSNFKNKYYKINPKTNSFEVLEPKAIGLNEGTIMVMANVDNHGNIWLGSNGWGLFKISPTFISFKKVKNFPIKNLQYAWPFRISKNGLNAVYDPISITRWFDNLEHTDLYKKGFVNTEYKEHFAMDGDGNYWFCLQNSIKNKSVIIKMNALSGAYQIVKEKKNTVLDNGFREFQPIFSDKKNRIWAAEYTRTDTVKIYLFEQGAKTTKVFIFPILQKSPSEQRIVSDWAEDPDGTIWLATTMGLLAFNPETGKWKVYGEGREKNKTLSLNRLLSVCLDPNQPQKYVWVGTEGGGLNRLDKTTGIITVFTMENGLPNNVIYSIQSDNHKNLWLSTNNGLCLFNPITLKCRNFDKSHGLEGNEFNRYMFSKSKTGEIYLGGVGFNVNFNPDDFYKQTTSANIAINSLKILNKEITVENQANQKVPIITKALEYTQKISLNHNQNMISFSFALLDLKNPTSNYYRYKLIGLYNDWVDNGKKNEATFTNLEPGSYTFIVSGQNGNGVWSNPAQMKLVIEPAWWQTWWFKAICLIIFIYLLYVFFQYRISKAVEMEKLRNRIAQDLHDEIGSTLSSVSIYSSALSKSFKNLPKEQSEIIDKISDSTISMMETMSDIVWSVNPANDSFENLINRMRAYASSVTEAADVRLNFESNLDNDKIHLSMLQRKNLYLIFKEAVNNSLKHSDCTNLHIKLSMTDRKLSLLVTDNGKGIEDKNHFESKMGGNGIANMHSRSKESDGIIDIVSRPEGGTSVQFTINV